MSAPRGSIGPEKSPHPEFRDGYGVNDDAVTLRPMNADDARRIADGDRPANGWAPEFPQVGDRASVTHWRAAPTPEQPWDGPWLICLGDLVVGSVGFKDAPSDSVLEVGYGVVATVRGRGVATTALTQLLAFVALRPLVVVAETAPTNVASRAVLGHVGFRQSTSRVDESGHEWEQWRLEPL